MLDLYTLYRLGERLYTGFSQHLPGGYALPPLQMVIELTYRCNLKCEMCYQRREREQLHLPISTPAQEMRTEEIQRLIAETPPWCIIIFSGGEPFVRADILDILAYATRKRRCHVVTNGALIAPETAQALVKLGLLSLGISIDGDQAIHDRIRGITGTFERAMAAIGAIRKHREQAGARWPLINLKTTITASNVRDLVHIVEIAKQVGADYCTYQIINTSLMISGLQLNDEMTPYSVRPGPIEEFEVAILEEQLCRLQQMPSVGAPVIRFLPNIPSQEIVAHYVNKLDLHSYTCGTPWSGVNVSPYGEAFPCLNYRVGNLRENSLQAVWQGSRYRDFRQALKRQGLFAGCVGCCDLTYRKNMVSVKNS